MASSTVISCKSSSRSARISLNPCGRVSSRRERNHDLHVPLPEDESQPAGPLRARLEATYAKG